MSTKVTVSFDFIHLKMINLKLATHLKVLHSWASFKKFHTVGHYLIFDDQIKNIFKMYLNLDFDMKVFESKFDMKLFGSHLI